MPKKSDIYLCYNLPMLQQFIVRIIGVFFVLSGTLVAQAQPSWTLDPFGSEKKPEKYEEKQLGSEKTATKKFTVLRRFTQNTTSHYNYFFNANNKLKEVMERATLSHQNDYTKLLTYFPYSLDNTAEQQVELDSVIYKAGAGILLHDLRSDWVDNFYLLIGQAYLFRKELDSAAMTFQFINYNLYPRKKNDDDTRIVGSNLNVDEKNRQFSIADKDKRSKIKKLFNRAHSRNESLLWLIRTFIEQGNIGEAAGLINILQHDPNLPKKLRPQLDVLTGYWFYQQNMLDSSANYLASGLSAANNKQEKARWEYLLGQMNEMNGNYDLAKDYYSKAAKHTVDPLLDIYANLNKAKMLRGSGSEKELLATIAKLNKMAKRDKYEAYRDILYYAAAKIAMDLPDTTQAMALYQKSIAKNDDKNPGYKSKAFFDMANISFHQREYKYASMYYDSTRIEDTAYLEPFDFDLDARKVILKQMVKHLDNIQFQDSIQMVAAMEEPARTDFVKQVLRRLRKEQGYKDEESGKGGAMQIKFDKDDDKPRDLFQSDAKGEWYFYNKNLRSKGENEFISKWGRRPNVDNWRRSAAMSKVINNGMMPSGMQDSIRRAEEMAANELTLEKLLADLPLTPEQLDSSNGIIAHEMLSLAEIFLYDLEDYEQAINLYELYLQRFPQRLMDGEVYAGLYYAYYKLGDYQKANEYKDLLAKQFSGTMADKKVNDPESLNPNKKDPAVEAQYARIYDLFIEGDVAAAVELKRKADIIHGENYWTPQLLYIEAVQYIQQRDDSTAMKVLNRISVLYPNTPIQKKALQLMDVLERRPEIEAYLRSLEIERAAEDPTIYIEDDKPAAQPAKAPEKQVVTAPKTPEQPVITAPEPKGADPDKTDGVFTIDEKKVHYVIMVMNKVDGVFQNEAKNAFTRYNREMFNSYQLKIDREVLDNDNVVLVTGSFDQATTALNYFDKVKQAAPKEVSWLPRTKYYFMIIDADNLELLRQNKQLDAYRALLNKVYNNKF